MKKDNAQKELEGLSFEKALERLEAVVAKMESGKLPLDEMMRYFEEGSLLSSVCDKKLKELEKKIEILVSEEGQGGKWREFGGEGVKAEGDADEPDDKKDSLL